MFANFYEQRIFLLEKDNICKANLVWLPCCLEKPEKTIRTVCKADKELGHSMQLDNVITPL